MICPSTARRHFCHQPWIVLTLGLVVQSYSVAADKPGAVDPKRVEYITSVLQSPNSLEAWFELSREGERVLPYFEAILANPENTNRVIDRALIFARLYLSKHDCQRLIYPTFDHLMNDDWRLRASAMQLLREIGSREDSPAVVLLLHSDSERHRNRLGAVLTIAKLGGRRELFVLDNWSGWESMEKDFVVEGKKAREELRERLEKEAKAKPTEPTEADKVVAKFADADAKVRAEAVEALKKVGSRADSSAVVALLHDPDAKVRSAAAEWLGVMGGKRELIALEIRLRQPKASDDEAFDTVAKAKRAVAERVEADEKKLKAKSPEKK